MSHIAFFVPSLRGGGAERVMVTLANGFANHGHQIDLVLVCAEGPYLTEVSHQVRVVDLDRARALSGLLPLVRYLRREQPDSMLSALNHANIVAIWARMIAGVNTRLVVSEHNAPSQSLTGGGLKRAMRGLIRTVYPQADSIVCVSNGIESEMARMLSLPQNKLTTIFNPVDLERIRSMMHERVSHPWLEETTVPVILAVGRLTAQKDYPCLLRALAHLKIQRRARLVILGEGEEEIPLKSMATNLGLGDEVAFMGFQQNPFAWMRRCSLYVMSSAWEGLPGTLLEAMACGAKVVSTDCHTGPSEILECGRWGRLVPVGDPVALSNAIGDALDEPIVAGVNARLEAFRPEISISNYARVLGV